MRFARSAAVLALFVAGCGRAPAAPSALGQLSLTPASGPVGSTVTLTGTGFSRENNIVKFGPGYISGIPSPTGTSVQFTVPDRLDACPPASLGSTAACADMYPLVQPGEYTVIVVSPRIRGEGARFTVTRR